jgi:hypothetical protein
MPYRNQSWAVACLLYLSSPSSLCSFQPLDVTAQMVVHEGGVSHPCQLTASRRPVSLGCSYRFEVSLDPSTSNSLARRSFNPLEPAGIDADGWETRVPVPLSPCHFIAVSSLSFCILILSRSRSSRFLPFSCTSIILFSRCCLFLTSCSLVDCRSAICCSSLNSPVSCFFFWS